MIYRHWLLLYRAWLEFRIRRHGILIAQCAERRAMVLAELAQDDEREQGIW